MKLIVISIISSFLSSCMTDAAGNRRVDPEARKFYGGLAVKAVVRAIIAQAEDDGFSSGK